MGNYIILRGSAGTPKCITNVDVMPNNITFQIFSVRSNYCSFTYDELYDYEKPRGTRIYNTASFTAVYVNQRT